MLRASFSEVTPVILIMSPTRPKMGLKTNDSRGEFLSIVRTSKVRGSRAFHVGKATGNSFQRSGKRLDWLRMAEPGLHTGVCEPPNKCHHPQRPGSAVN